MIYIYILYIYIDIDIDRYTLYVDILYVYIANYFKIFVKLLDNSNPY